MKLIDSSRRFFFPSLMLSTPLWRDMGKDMPLCNACGIRWKKYGIVCDVCQYVPCKQERENKYCKRCTALLPPPNKRARANSPQTVPTPSTTPTKKM